MAIQDQLSKIVALATGASLTAPYPPVALDLEADALSLVRFKASRRGKPLLEAHVRRRLDEAILPDSIFDSASTQGSGLAERLAELFESTGTRPGKLSMVIPDNLAKITLVTLPERPANATQLDELVRAKMRRAVPFRLEDASLSYQLFPSEGREVSVLVILVHRALIDQLEAAVRSIGGRPGLIDLATPNLLNLMRGEMERLSSLGSEPKDVALLNCAARYFSLVIVRRGRVIFFRCKTFNHTEDGVVVPNGTLAREVGNSFSYYREKLAGEGIGHLLVRSTSMSTDLIEQQLEPLDCGEIHPIEFQNALQMADGVRLDREAAQFLAPAIGAAVGRTAKLSTAG